MELVYTTDLQNLESLMRNLIKNERRRNLRIKVFVQTLLDLFEIEEIFRSYRQVQGRNQSYLGKSITFKYIVST